MTTRQLTEIKDYIREKMARSPDKQHGPDHLERVAQSAAKIVRLAGLEKKIDLKLLEAACWLHDLTYLKRGTSWQSYLFESWLAKKELEEFFKNQFLSKKEKKIICEAILAHPLSFPFRKLSSQKSLYAQILQDADTLDNFNYPRMEKLVSGMKNLGEKVIRAFFHYGEKNFPRYFNFPQFALELATGKKFEFSCQEWGSSKKTLICLPGYANRKSLFETLGKKLGKKYRIIAVDWPTSQGSPAPETATSLACYLENFVRKRKLKKFTLAGFSLGGWTAIEYATLFPEKVEKLLVLSSPPRPIKNRLLLRIYPLLRPILTGKFFCRVFLKLNTNRTIRKIRGCGELKSSQKKMMRSYPEGVFGTLFNNLDIDLEKKINHLKIPVKAFFAKDDGIASWKKYRKIIERTHWQVELTEKGGHGQKKAYWQETAKLFN